MDILQTILRTASSPFVTLLNSLHLPQVNSNVYQPQNQAQYRPPMPVEQQPPLTPSMELQQIEAELGLSISRVNDATAASYLQKSRQALVEFRNKKQYDQAGFQKLNASAIEQNQKAAQKEQSNLQSYQDRENFRINNANQHKLFL